MTNKRQASVSKDPKTFYANVGLVNSTSADFLRVFRSLQVNFIILKPDSPHFTILDISDQLLQITGRKRQEVINRSVFDALPEHPAHLAATWSSCLMNSLSNVLESKQFDQIPQVRYDVQNSNGVFEERYWSANSNPVLNSDGEISYIVYSPVDVTEQVIARRKLEEIEHKFRNVVQQASDMILIVKGEELIIEVANEALLQLWQAGKEVINKPLGEITPEMVEQGFVQIVRDVFHTGIPYNGYEVQAVLQRKNGVRQTRYFNFRYQAYREADESITGVLIFASDVTEQVLTRNKLNESESRFRSIVEQAPVAFTLTRGKDLVVEAINAPMLKIIGRSNSERIIGRTMLEVLPEIKDQPIYKMVNHVLETGESFVGNEIPIKLKSGDKLKERHYNLSYTPLIEDGEITGVLHVATDVTEHVMSRRKVEASEQELRSFIESAPFPIGIYTGKEMRIQFVNQAILEAWGKGNDVIGKLYSDVLPEVSQEIFQQLESVYVKGVAFHAKNKRVDLMINGKLRPYYFNYHFTPLRNAEGKVYGVMNTAADVTDLNIAHKKIEESERNLRNIILQAPVAMSILRGPKYVIEIANDRMFELWGKKKDDLLNKDLFEGLPEIREQGFEELLARVYNTGETFSAYGSPVTLPRQGKIETCYINFVYEALREGDGSISGIMVVASDVTQQVVASKKIEEAEESARLAVQSAELGTFEINLTTNEIIASPRMAAIFDLEEGEADRSRYIAAIHPDDLNIRAEAFEKAAKTGIVDYDGRVIWKDGSVHWIRIRGRMYNNKENKPVRLLGVIQDITEQKEFSEALHKQVIERTAELEAKNKELEQFTYAASHDMQEPLRKVQTFTNLLTSSLASKVNDHEKMYLQKIETSVSRMKSIIDDLLKYSHTRKEDQNFVSIDLNLVLKNVQEDLELVIAHKKAVIDKETLPSVNGVPSQISQLFQNLINNALKFSRPDVPPVIRIFSKSMTPFEISERKALKRDQNYMEITFKDNGIGFAPEYSDQIFALFRRLHGKSEYEGTGIGLSLCKKIVENHNGDIFATSQLGEGAAFHVILPI